MVAGAVMAEERLAHSRQELLCLVYILTRSIYIYIYIYIYILFIYMCVYMFICI